VWPATPLAPLPVERRPVVLGKGGALYWGDPGDREAQDLPEEWVLRPPFRSANLDDDDDVVGLLQNFGEIDRWDDLDLVPEPVRTLLKHQMIEAVGKRTEWDFGEAASVEDARWQLKKARALAGVWREAMFGRPIAPAFTAEGLRRHNAVSEILAWTDFAEALNKGLRPFQARVEHALKFEHGVVVEGRPHVDLYSAACCQIFNLIVEGGTARVCENETCSVVFVHQLGGSLYGQYHKTGLRFCSPACARMETQRQYRRRQKVKKAEEGGSR
jgi:hypothetical protein